MSGKGSKARPFSVSKSQFSKNWDNIFNKNKSNNDSEDLTPGKEWYLHAINAWYKFYTNPVTGEYKQIPLKRHNDKS